MTARRPLVLCDLAAQRERLEPGLSAAIQRVLDHGQFVLGPEVTQLERELEAFCGAPHAITCANGTDAIELVMMAEGIGRGDAVVTPSFTFVATAEAVATAGATPIFADIDPETFNLDASSVARCLDTARASGLNLKAVIAVDLFGLPADYEALRRVCDSYRVLLIADAAQSFGGRSPAGAAGTLGDYTTTSFFPSKPLGCYGDGGAVFTADRARADLLTSLRFHGKGSDKYDNVRLGINSRLDTIQAAILLQKLTVFRDELVQRNLVAQRYTQTLSKQLATPIVPEGFSSAWAQYTLRCDDSDQRRRIQAACEANNIATAIYYPKALHQQTGYKHLPTDPAGLTSSEHLADRVLSLPMHPYLTAEEQEFIASVVVAASS